MQETKLITRFFTTATNGSIYMYRNTFFLLIKGFNKT